MTGYAMPGVPAPVAAELGRMVLVPMFIALSGFLLAASASRSGSVWRFALNRVLRIFPALVILTVVTTLVIGPIVTVLPLSEYFTDFKFWRYLLVAFSWISFDLPGVFLTHPEAEVVNSSLWSIPVELQCYVAIIGMMMAGMMARRAWILMAWLVVLALTLSPFVMGGTHGAHFHITRFMWQFAYFMTGMVIYLYRERIPRHELLFWASLSMAAILMMLECYPVLLPITVTYCAVYIATAELSKPPGLPNGDYSYGIYLYGALVQQLVISVMVPPYAWWLNFILALPITYTCAIASWHLVERPALALKGRQSLPMRPVSPSPAFASVPAAGAQMPIDR
jgi:peptidoglycan/LPS O-acetylase OafA/YrhL